MAKNFIQILVIVVLSILLLNQCSKNRTLKSNNKSNQLALLDSVSYYKNSLGFEVAEKRAFQGTAKELKVILDQKKAENAQLAEAVKKWKKISSITEVGSVVKIKEVKVPFEVKVPCDFQRTFNKVEPFYSINGNVNQFGVKIDSILFNNTQTIVVGSKKIGFFKTEYRVESTNSNPFIKNTQLDNFSFTERKKRFGIGVSFGVGVYSGNFFIGPSVNYNIIQF
jgi:hypothetical protein